MNHLTEAGKAKDRIEKLYVSYGTAVDAYTKRKGKALEDKIASLHVSCQRDIEEFRKKKAADRDAKIADIMAGLSPEARAVFGDGAK